MFYDISMTEISEPTDFLMYRYHISVSESFIQKDLFNGIDTKEELTRRKNDLFREVLQHLPQLADDESLKFVPEPHTEGPTQFLFHVQKQTKKNVEQNFAVVSVKHQPSAWLAIETDENCQVIAVQPRFQPKYTAVMDRLIYTVQTELLKQGLIFQAHTIKRENRFWEFVDEHKESIKGVVFKISPPNMPALSKVLSTKLNQLVASTSAENGELTLTAPRAQTLQLAKTDKSLSGLVEYIDLGGGDYSFRQVGSKKVIRPKQIIEVVTATPQEENMLIQRNPEDSRTSIFKKIVNRFRL